MLYISIFSNKLDLTQAIRVSHRKFYNHGPWDTTALQGWTHQQKLEQNSSNERDQII